jgi:Transglutaminase-like superfamily
MRRASQLHNVMEHGLGSPVVMAVLYMEVATRVGLRLAPVLLDGGEDFAHFVWSTSRTDCRQC